MNDDEAFENWLRVCPLEAVIQPGQSFKAGRQSMRDEVRAVLKQAIDDSKSASIEAKVSPETASAANELIAGPVGIIAEALGIDLEGDK